MKIKKMMSLALSALILLTMTFGLSPTKTFAGEPDTVSVGTWNELLAAVAAAKTDGTQTIINVTANITADSDCVIISGKNIVIQSSSGSIITRDAMFTSGSVFDIRNNADLTLKDITLDGNGTNTTATDPLVYSNCRTFTMDGATIQNAKIDSEGTSAGIHLVVGTVYMKNGTKITDCTNISTTGDYGGAVFVGFGTLSIADNCSIKNNQGNQGGGICVFYAATLNLSGSPDISGNTKADGTTPCNVYLTNGTEIINVTEPFTPVTPIGITSNIKPTAVSSVNVTTAINSSDLSGCFVSDNPNYITKNSGSGSTQRVQLAVPSLTGTVNLAVDAATGQVTASASGGNTGSAGTLTYTWSGSATGTGTTATPTLGAAATCTVTASGTPGSIQATTTVYKVAVSKSGNTGTDDASITNAYGQAGDNVSIAYTLDNSGTASNTLTYSGAALNPAMVSTSGSGTSTYVIVTGDAESGTVNLTATFAHTASPVLSGTITLTVDQSTGQVTASASGGNTGSAGTLTYTWSGSATGTGTTATPTLGAAATCTVTASGAVGSIQATTTVYKVAVSKSGNTGTDDASITNAYGQAGDNVSIAYTLGNSGTESNTLTYSGAALNPATVSTAGSGTSPYVIVPGDAASGTVTLTATFAHTASPVLSGTITLTVDQSTGQVTAIASNGNTGSAGTLTYTWSGSTTGTGATATPTLGAAVTCTVTASGAAGSIQATTTVYKVAVSKTGNTGTDDASITNAYGQAGDNVSIAYTLGNSGTASNTLTYSGAALNPATVSTAGSGTSPYVIVPGDAASGTVTLTATFAHTSVSNDGGSVTTPLNNNTIIIVDGTKYLIGTENTNGSSTLATVEQSKLADDILKASDGSSTIFPVSSNTTVTARLVVKNIEDMAKKTMTLTVQTGNISYNLSTNAIDTAQIKSALATQDTVNIPFDVNIKNSNAVVNGATVVVSPVEFTITATYNGKTVTIDTFTSFVNRTVEVTAEQANQITTAVVLAQDGSLRHVPTRVIKTDGKYYAVINSLTNSTYSVIWHPIEFADVTASWAKNSINNMGSRMVVNGVGNNNFAPDGDITRAEFAAIIVRALGLAPGNGMNSFNDVHSTDWYCGYVETASTYGIITGYNDKTFGPLDKITREQVMTMVARAMSITKLAPELTVAQIEAQLAQYKDASSITEFAKAGVAACTNTGVVLGKPNNKIAAKDFISRAEVAVIVERLLKKSGLI